MNTRPTALFPAIALLLLAGCASDNPQRNAQRLQYGLWQDVGVDSYPRGARVQIDGEMVGVTPLSAKLRSTKTYEVVFERSGYKPYVEYIGPDLDLKLDPFIKIGPLENSGMYNRLGPNPLQVELEHELVPDIAGTNLLEEMLLKTEQLDKHLTEEMISIEEHRYVTRQILEYYKDESIRRGKPILVENTTPSLASPATPALPPVTPPPGTSIPDISIPGELPDLNAITLDAAPTGTAPVTSTPPAALPAMPDLSNLDLGAPPPVGTPEQAIPTAPPPPAFTVPGEQLPPPLPPSTQPSAPALPSAPITPDNLLEGI